MANISMKRASKAAKLRNKMREEIVVVYTAQRAGQDNAPLHDATSEPDRNNTAQQHVVNSAPIRERAANAEFQRNRED
jgi:hypothetical protein